MLVQEAFSQASNLNLVGKHRAAWFYFPAYYERQKEWFVARRPKQTQIVVAIFVNGKVAIAESEADD